MKFVIAIVAIVLLFFGVCFGRAYLSCRNFENALTAVTVESPKLSDRHILSRVNQAADLNRIRIKKDGLSLNRSQANDYIVISVEYIVNVDMIKKVYPWHRKAYIEKSF